MTNSRFFGSPSALSARLLMGVARVSIVAAAFGIPTAALAQENIETVVVTAQKKVEPLSNVTASVAVIGTDTLQTSGVTVLDDIGKVVPSLASQPTGTNLHIGFAMRGISTTVISIGSPSGTAVMLDGITLAPESMAAKNLVDIQDVEVLRGPQATLGGRTASDGVVNIVTRQPGDTFGGQVQATLTNDNEQRLQAFVTGPLSPMLAFSLSAFAGNTDYPTYNLNTGDPLVKQVHDSERAGGARLKLRFAPTENFDATLAVSGSRIEDKGTFQAYTLLDSGACFRGSAHLCQSVSMPGITVNSDNFAHYNVGSPGMTVDDRMYSLVMNYRANGWTFSSITARQEENRNLLYDVYNEGANSSLILSSGTYSWNMIQTSILKVRTTSQEFKVVSPQIGIVNFLAGVYFDRDVEGFAFDRPAFGTSAPLVFGANRQSDTKTYAAYARAEWTLMPDLQLITGARVNYDKIDYMYNQLNLVYHGPSTSAFVRTDSASQTTVVGDVALRYHFTPDVMTYASYSHGYKPMIWNLDGTVTATNTFLPINREDVNAYEIGMKGNFFDHRLVTNLSAFYSVYTNFQVQTFDPNAVSSTFAVANAGQVSTKGIELDSTAMVTENFSLNASMAYVDARFDKYDAANCYSNEPFVAGLVTGINQCGLSTSGQRYQTLTGTRMPAAPTFKFNLGANLKIPMPSLPFDGVLGGAYVWQSKVDYDPNGNPLAVQPAFGILNLNASLVDRDEKYSLALFVNNVLDTHYVSYITDLSARWNPVGAVPPIKAALDSFIPRDSKRYFGVRLGVNF